MMSEQRVQVGPPPPPGDGLMGDARVLARPGWVEVDGRAAIPVVAGMDFSRVRPEQWTESLRRLRQQDQERALRADAKARVAEFQRMMGVGQ